MLPDLKPARRGQSPVALGGEPALATPTAESLSVVVANIESQEVRVNLLPIQTPTQREVGKLHDQISDLFGHRDNPLATDILIMLGQGKMKKTYPMERDLRYADLHFEYKPGPARTPSPKEVAVLIGRLRDARVNLADGFGDKRFKKIDFMDPEAWKQSQKEEVILARTLAILGQADVARRVEADENRAVVLGNPPGPVAF